LVNSTAEPPAKPTAQHVQQGRGAAAPIPAAPPRLSGPGRANAIVALGSKGPMPLHDRPAAPAVLVTQTGGKRQHGGGSSSCGSGVAQRGGPCVQCGCATSEQPHRAACNHVACYKCWLTAVALQGKVAKCAACGAGVRKDQLKKVYFDGGIGGS
jgi:hypothetical protein